MSEWKTEKIDMQALAELMKISLTEEEKQLFSEDILFLLHLAESLPQVREETLDMGKEEMILRKDLPDPFPYPQKLLSHFSQNGKNEISVPEIMDE